MYRVNELFGIYTNGAKEAEAELLDEALQVQICPYSNNMCYKNRKSDPKTKLGICSAYIGSHTDCFIICPNRLKERNRIFNDCIPLLTQHEPGNDLYLIPEVKATGNVGTVDYFLISAYRDSVMDFVGIELQALDTTGALWPSRVKYLYDMGLCDSDKAQGNPPGVNWKMTEKTILTQMIQKSKVFEAMEKHIVLVSQDVLYKDMETKFDFSYMHDAVLMDIVHFHAYSFEPSPHNEGMDLKLSFRKSTSHNGIARSMGSISAPDDALKEMTSILESKISEEFLYSPILGEAAFIRS